MVAAVDSSILVDVFTNDAVHGQRSLELLRRARNEGAVIVCPIVWGELRAFFDTGELLQTTMQRADIQFDPFDVACADLAGEYWRIYRASGGKRSRVVADFFVGAHAVVRAGRLLTRDRGFYRRYFSHLEVLE